jgi:hypothetical protein
MKGMKGEPAPLSMAQPLLAGIKGFKGDEGRAGEGGLPGRSGIPGIFIIVYIHSQTID